MTAPPATDEGTLPNLRFSFADAHKRIEDGGWAREVTERELPVASTLAGVNMCLEPGAIRELHWHEQAEWACMLSGRARITGLDPGGGASVDDVGEGDLWYFPAGFPHSIQGLAAGAEFLLVFDDGGFSENATFLVTDWLAHTPRGVLARNLGVAEAALDPLPDDELYIFGGRVPEGDKGQGRFTHRLSAQPALDSPGGRVRIADSSNFPVSRTVAAALVEVAPGGLRELHWHPNAAEWQYYLEGSGRMTVFGAAGRARTFDYAAGDVGYVPFAMGHYVENVGTAPLRFLELFRSDRFADVSLARWLALTPRELVAAHLGVDGDVLDALCAEHRPIVR
jgi:oxalate decarboxylase